MVKDYIASYAAQKTTVFQHRSLNFQQAQLGLLACLERGLSSGLIQLLTLSPTGSVMAVK